MPVSLGASGKSVKSVQRGTSTVAPSSTANISITAVVLAKSFVSVSNDTGATYGGSISSGGIAIGARLTTTTNIRFDSGHGYYGTYITNPTAMWEVIEFE